MQRAICRLLGVWLVLACGPAWAANPSLHPCKAPADCKSRVCLQANAQSYCSGPCDSGDCPSGMYCDRQMFGWSGMQAACVKGTGPQVLTDLPRVRCREDRDCPGGICTLDHRERFCSRPCKGPDECAQEPVYGTRLDFMQCGRDGGGRRSACITKDNCVSKPASCVMSESSAEAAAAESPQPIADDAFDALLHEIRAKPRAPDKLTVLQEAATHHWFLCQQVVKFVGLMATSEQDKVRVVEILAARLIDPNNQKLLLNAMPTPKDLERARKALAAAAPGTP